MKPTNLEPSRLSLKKEIEKIKTFESVEVLIAKTADGKTWIYYEGEWYLKKPKKKEVV